MNERPHECDCTWSNDPAAGPWKCFFCGEIFLCQAEASAHFGDRGGLHTEPGCVCPLRDDEKMRRREHVTLLRNLDLASQARDKAQDDADAYHAQSTELERLFGKGRNTAREAWLEFDDMEGRALAAEEKIATAEARITQLEEEMNRQKAKTEYEAERAGNFENDLDVAKAKVDDLRQALEPFAMVPPGGHGETERLIVMSAGNGPYHFLESDLVRAKAIFGRKG